MGLISWSAIEGWGHHKLLTSQDAWVSVCSPPSLLASSKISKSDYHHKNKEKAFSRRRQDRIEVKEDFFLPLDYIATYTIHTAKHSR